MNRNEVMARIVSRLPMIALAVVVAVAVYLPAWSGRQAVIASSDVTTSKTDDTREQGGEIRFDSPLSGENNALTDGEIRSVTVSGVVVSKHVRRTVSFRVVKLTTPEQKNRVFNFCGECLSLVPVFREPVYIVFLFLRN